MDYKKVEEDRQYLAKTDERYAELKAGVEHMKNMLKSVKGSFVTNSKESVSKATEAFYADKNYIDVRIENLTSFLKEINILQAA